MDTGKHLNRRAALGLLAAPLLAGLATACGAGAPAATKPPVAAVAAAGTLPLKYSKLFGVAYLEGGAKLVHDGDGAEIVLVSAGQTAPAGYAGRRTIATPVSRIVVLSNTYLALLRPLGELDSLVGISSTIERVRVDEVAAQMSAGTTQSVGTSPSNPDYEVITSLNPEIVFGSTGTDASVEVKAKLAELQIPFASVNSWLEEDPLARAEWIKFIAAFYDQEAVATAFFDAMEQRVKNAAAAAAGATSRPKVLWAWASAKGEHWAPNGGKYEAAMIDMAGGDYLFSDLEGTGNSVLTPEEMAARGRDADIFIYAMNPPTINTLDEVKALSPIFAGLDVVRQGKVWCFQPWYWQVLDKTDEIIEDLAALFHPELFPDHEVRHFLKL